jgi:hypothetical protein
MERTEIAMSKSKMTKMLTGSIAFVLIGLWLLIFQPTIGNPLFDNVIVKYGIAIAAILFFGYTLFFSIKKLADKKPGIVIDDSGIYDNSSAVSVGLIPWTDIRQISTVTVMRQEFVIIGVSNPEHYINKQPNFLKRKGMQYNYKNYGSPIAISANGLKCNVKDLVRLLEERIRI